MEGFSDYQNQKAALLIELAIFTDDEREKIEAALTLAERSHTGQTRSGEGEDSIPYVIHCVRVSRWLVEQGINDAAMIMAALLHDTLEDTSLDQRLIEERFGEDVLMLVLAVTRPREPDESEEDKRTNKPKHFKIILGHADPRVRWIKTADVIDNTRGWLVITQNHPILRDKMPRWIHEANEWYIPIAESVHPAAAGEIRKIVETIVARQRVGTLAR